jgi:hypothetical protein
MADDVTHGDILRAIGNMEGQLQAILTNLANSRTDMNTAFNRIRALETRVAQGVILAIAASVIIPLIVTALNPQIYFRMPASEQAPSNER